uniref:Type IV pilus assembly protein PilM n=1 Tax=Dictyoglomus thermophilum TaxID=14 RepID=A0A7C3RQ29_DICTH
MGIFNLFSSEEPILSIELGNPVRLVYGGRRKDKKIVIKNAVSFLFSPDIFQGGQSLDISKIVETLKKDLKVLKVKNPKTYIAIPSLNVVVRFFNFTYMPEEELREAIKWELDRYIPFSEEDIVYDLEIIDVIEREGSKECKVMLVAVPKEVINPYLEIVKSLGLNLEVVDISIFSAVRSVVFNRKELPKGNTLFLYTHDNIAEFVVLKDNQPIFFRSTIMEEWNPHEEGVDELTKSFILEDFVRKIQESINFFFLQFPEEHIDQAIVMGSNAKNKDFVDLLEALLNVPSEVAPLTLSSDVIVNAKKQDKSFLEDLSSWVVPIGLFFWGRM